MSDENGSSSHSPAPPSDRPSDKGDGMADAIAATAVISIIIMTLYFWLSGMPT